MTSDWLPNIPKPPTPLLNRAVERNLVVFVGAGVSMRMGSPSWAKFAEDVLDQIAQNKKVGYGALEQIRSLDPKKMLSIAIQIAGGKDKIKYKDILIHENDNKSQIYNHLKKFNCRIVTTNYDKFLHESLSETKITGHESDPANVAHQIKQEIICRPDQFEGDLLKETGPPVHLHGCIDDPNSMIITTSDYLDHYKKDGKVLKFLESLFSQYTVLFVGYSLEETEILEQIFQAAKTDKENSDNQKRFMLIGYFAHQEELFQHLYNYYRDNFRVYLVPYSKEEKNHGQLDLIIEDWASKIKFSPSDVAVFLKRVADNE